MIIIKKIKEFIAKDACQGCDYYNKENDTCRSKKCATSPEFSYVSWQDRKFCKPYKG